MRQDTSSTTLTGKFASLLLLILGGLTLSACNTTEGIGKDVAAAGEAIEDTAEEVGDELD